ncbi:MAG TPA: DUF499 domain-containing protein [Candidatus Acidoferrum sp.]|nr:DUF499 domain-containing protein [Candidatus Acidoferrum sp.]
MPLKPWIECVNLHPDVLKEDAGSDIFALDLGPLADNSGTVAPVYRDPEAFFRASYLTAGLKSLLEDVLKRLAGKGGPPVLKLLTPFGGGKSHAMAALYHGAGNRGALNVIPEGKGLADPGKVRIAVVDGQFFNAQKGKASDGIQTQTLWGWIALKLGGKKAYEDFRKNDEERGTPGADDLMKLFGDGPNLILLDEVLEYLINAGGVKVLKTDLREQTLNFIKELTVAASNSPRTVVVMALPSSQPRETLQHAQLLSTLDHFAGRKDALREPVEQDEVLKVIQRRLLEKLPDPAVADGVGAEFQGIVANMRKAYATSTADEQQADEEGIALHKRIRDAYPFHPALLDLMRQRWAALPEYQRTRGALRFLAVCLRSQRKAEKSGIVLSPGDVALADHNVRRALIKELSLMNRFDAAFEADLVGARARARRIDQRRAKENAAEVGKNVAQRLANAIFLFSFGGLRRETAGTTEVLPPGVTEPDLLAACVGPDLDSLTAKACLSELRQQCLYLHFDGVRYCFKQDPNVTLLIEQEADAVARDEDAVTNAIKEMLEQRTSGHHGAVIWPTESGAIPDKQPRFQLALLPLDFAAESEKTQDSTARDLLEKCGAGPRSYRNGIGLAVPSADQVEGLRREVRYLLAIERVRKNAKKLNLTKEQGEELREREATHASAAESALLKLYTEIWLPKLDSGAIALEKIAVGGRPLQTTLNEDHEAMVFERGMELIMRVQPRLFDSITPPKIVSLFKLGEGTPPRLGIPTADIVDGFFSFLGFTRLVSEAPIRKAIVRGIKECAFGYTTAPTPALGLDGKFALARSKVSFDATVIEDEIDLEAGFLIVPQAIPQDAPSSAAAPPGPTPPGPVPSGPTPPGPVPPGPTPPGPTPPAPGQPQTTVEFSVTADKDKVFTAWNAIANLAEMAGQVTLTIKAEKPDGFDKSKLNNGVLEPLREADLLQ